MSEMPPVGLATTYCCCSLYPQVIVPSIVIYHSALVLIPGLRYRALSAFARAIPKVDERSWLERPLRARVSSHDLGKESSAHRSPDGTRRP